MRKKEIQIPEVVPQPLSDVVTQERQYTLITPLFGGGAIKGERDEVTAVRGTEIRGQLRFWWRACYGGRYNTIEEMQRGEDLLWGVAAKSKKDEKEKEGVEEKKENEKKPKETTVQIMVEPIKVEDIKELPAYEIDKKGKPVPDFDIPGYAAFPLQPTSDGKPAKLIYKNVRFCLTISFPSNKQQEIRGALWAWETFGGVGARTRRGFGAIKLEGIMNVGYVQGEKIRKSVPAESLPIATTIGVKEWLKKEFLQFGIEKKAPEGVPSLSRQMLDEQIYILLSFSKANQTWVSFRNVSEAWKTIVDKLRAFRQDKQWPDSREIKKLKNADEGLPAQKYELLKAPLGLPVVFHFPKEGKDADLTLQGGEEGHERLSSPLILRPLLCQGEQYLGLVVLLENYAPHLENVQVMKKVDKELQKMPAIIETNLGVASNKNISLLRGEKDVLRAFITYLQSPRQRNNQNENRERR